MTTPGFYAETTESKSSNLFVCVQSPHKNYYLNTNDQELMKKNALEITEQYRKQKWTKHEECVQNGNESSALRSKYICVFRTHKYGADHQMWNESERIEFNASLMS